MKNVMKKIIKTVGDADDPMITAPMIDKLSAVIDLSDVKMCGLAFSGLLSWWEHGELGIVKVKPSRKYQIAADVHYPLEGEIVHNGCPAIRLEITSPKVSKRQVRVEYNPRNLTLADMAYVDALFHELFGVESFYELLGHARFTRVDWCRDILYRDIEDYLIKGKWKKVSQCFFGTNGKLQTITLGKAGNNQVTAYDKAAEMHGPNAGFGIIRIEARCRINLTINKLASFANPFQNVEVYSVACKNPPLGIAHWRAFADSCRLRGVGGAIKNQPVKCRSALKKALSAQPVSWWQMTEDEWDFLMTAALEDAGLMEIPDSPPPLTAAFHIGQAA